MINWIKKITARFRNNRLDRLEAQIQVLSLKLDIINENYKAQIERINNVLKSHDVTFKLLDREMDEQLSVKKWTVGKTATINPPKIKKTLSKTPLKVKRRTLK